MSTHECPVVTVKLEPCPNSDNLAIARIYGAYGPVWLSCNDPRCLSTRKPFLGPGTEIRVQCWSKFEADDNPTALAMLVKSRPNNYRI